MSKPVLLMDVDGCLCPFGNVPAHFPSLRLGSEELRVIPELDEQLALLSTAYQLVWATSREHWANFAFVLAGHIRLPVLPVIEFSQAQLDDPTQFERDRFVSCAGEYSWKLPWIKQWVARTAVPFAWFDDCIDDEALAWSGSLGIPNLLIEVRPHTGLTIDDMRRLLAFSEGTREWTISSTASATESRSAASPT